jgi:hypothetical protein
MADTKEARFDGTFYNNFKAIWNGWFVRYIPLPDDAMKAIVGVFADGWLGHKLLVEALAVGPGSTKIWWDTLPKLSMSAKNGLTAHKELRAVLSVGAWAGYTGLLIGTAIVAAYETWGGARLRPLAREVERITGRSFDRALEIMLLQANFHGEPFQKAMHIGRMVSSPKLVRRSGASGSW